MSEHNTATKTATAPCDLDLAELQRLGFVTIVEREKLFEIQPRQQSFGTIKSFWLFLTLSLALDLVWVPYFADLEHHNTTLQIILPWLLGVLAALGLFPSLLLSLSERLQRLQSDVLTRFGRRLLPIMLGLLPFLAMLEITARIGLAIWLAFTLALAASIPITYLLAPKIRAQLENKLRHPRNRFVRSNALRRRSLILAIAPLICARAISVAAAVAERSSLQFMQNWHPWLAISGLLLVLLKPNREDWIWQCPHCGLETVRALGRLRNCLACVQQRFRAIQRE